MDLITTLSCLGVDKSTSQIFGMDIADFVTAGISIITLLLNILFYIIIAPRISFRFQKKEDFLKYSSEFIDYLAKVNSFTEFDGALTKVKSYCVTIKLLFKDGEAPEPLSSDMEDIYQSIKCRKGMTSEEEIAKWEEDFRKKEKQLRKSLAKYTGVFWYLAIKQPRSRTVVVLLGFAIIYYN